MTCFQCDDRGVVRIVALSIALDSTEEATTQHEAARILLTANDCPLRPEQVSTVPCPECGSRQS